MEKIISRNRMSVESLKSMNNDALHIKENPKKVGSFFFVCGDVASAIAAHIGAQGIDVEIRLHQHRGDSALSLAVMNVI